MTPVASRPLHLSIILTTITMASPGGKQAYASVLTWMSSHQPGPWGPCLASRHLRGFLKCLMLLIMETFWNPFILFQFLFLFNFMSLLFNILDKSHMLKIQCVSDHLRSSLSLKLPGCIRAQQRSMANLEGCGSFISFFLYKFLYCLNLFKIKNEALMLLNLGHSLYHRKTSSATSLWEGQFKQLI